MDPLLLPKETVAREENVTDFPPLEADFVAAVFTLSLLLKRDFSLPSTCCLKPEENSWHLPGERPPLQLFPGVGLCEKNRKPSQKSCGSFRLNINFSHRYLLCIFFSFSKWAGHTFEVLANKKLWLDKSDFKT